MSEKVRTVQIVDGTWYALGDYDRDICCDCGLVHDTEFKMERGRIFFRYKVNRRATNAHRKQEGISVTKRGNTRYSA